MHYQMTQARGQRSVTGPDMVTWCDGEGEGEEGGRDEPRLLVRDSEVSSEC